MSRSRFSSCSRQNAGRLFTTASFGITVLSSLAFAGPIGEVGIGRTLDNRLIAHVGFTPPKPIPRSIFPNLTGYATSLIGFENVPIDEPDEGIFTLSSESDIRVTMTGISPGFRVYDGFTLLSPGSVIEFGPPFFDSHPIYNIPSPSAAPGESYEARFVLHDTSGLYADSDEFAIILTPACTADLDDGSGIGIPDGGVTIDDLLYYLVVFEQGRLAADVDDGSGSGIPDGGVTIDDLLYYLERFENGC